MANYFLSNLDYYKFASETNLDVILKQSRGVSGDENLLNSHSQMAVEFCLNYLSALYRTDEIFANLLDYNDITTYTWNDRILLTADNYSLTAVYAEDDYVLYNGSVYRKNSDLSGYVAGTLPTNATYFVLLGLEGVYYITPPNKYNDAKIYLEDNYVVYNYDIYKRTDSYLGAKNLTPSAESVYWDKIADIDYLTEYSSLGNMPKNASYWTYGDNRNQTLVRYCVDIALYNLHTVINPRNIPQLRMERFKDAVGFLQSCMEGLLNPVLPQYTANKGYKIRFGSNEQFKTTY